MGLTSIWLDRHPRAATTDPGEVGGQYDVVVVGAGLTGLTTALLLARAGRSVLVLEARRVGAGTTGGSTAKASLLQGTRLSSILRKHGEDVTRRYVEANSEGQSWMARFCEEHGVEAQRRPAYTFATSGRGERLARAELAAGTQVGLDMTWVDQPQLPFDTHGAVTLAEQLQIDPVAYADALARDAVDHGVTLVEGVRVRRVTGRGPVTVETERGTVTTRTVVVATNLPFLDRGGFFARAEPSRSYGLAYRTPEQAVDGMYLSADTPSRSLRDAPGPLLLVGGNGHRTGAPVSESRRLDQLRAWTAQHYPQAEETHAWSAQDYLPHHGLPFVGPVLPEADHVLVAGGYSKWGLTNGTAAALALAGRILGGHQTWASVFEPWAARELRGTLTALKLNGEVALEMTWGWLRPLSRPGIGPSSDEGEGVVRADRVGTPTAVSRVGGTERRVSAVCTHLGGIVRWNDAESSWDCPLHASRYAPDGSVLEGPATCGLTRRG